jgi:hypothetical protein
MAWESRLDRYFIVKSRVLFCHLVRVWLFLNKRIQIVHGRRCRKQRLVFDRDNQSSSWWEICTHPWMSYHGTTYDNDPPVHMYVLLNWLQRIIATHPVIPPLIVVQYTMTGSETEGTPTWTFTGLKDFVGNAINSTDIIMLMLLTCPLSIVKCLVIVCNSRKVVWFEQ